MALRLSMLSHCAILALYLRYTCASYSDVLYAINMFLSSLESKQNYLKAHFK